MAAKGVSPSDDRLRSEPYILFLSPEPDDCILILLSIKVDDKGVRGVCGVNGVVGVSKVCEDPRGGFMNEADFADKSFYGVAELELS